MARIADPSLSYSVIDTRFSRKTMALKVRLKFGTLGHLMLYEVIAWINEGKGCYAEYNEDTAMTFAADRLGRLEHTQQVEEILKYMVEVGFFDKRAFDEDKILTSKGIVKRWATAKRNPDAYELPPSVIRLMDNGEGGINTASIPENVHLSRNNGNKCAKNGIPATQTCINPATTGINAGFTGFLQHKRALIPQQRGLMQDLRDSCNTNVQESPLERDKSSNLLQESHKVKESKVKESKVIYNIPPSSAQARAYVRVREGPETDEPAEEAVTHGEPVTPDKPTQSRFSVKDREAAEAKINLWNEITRGTDRTYTEFYPPESLIASIVDRLRKTPDEETWVKVYTNARDDLGFPWTLHAVFAKPTTFDQLKVTVDRTARARDKPARFGMDKPGFGKQGYYTKQE